MEIFGSVQPLVLTHEGYQLVSGEDDPEELAIMQVQARELALALDSVLQDLYYLETSFAAPAEGEGLSEEVGTVEELAELREIAAALHGKTVEEYQTGQVTAGFQFNHLINHAETDGYYVPVDFMQAFAFEFQDQDVSVGSAVALLAELDALEPVLAERYPEQVALAVATPDDEERAPLSGPVGVWHSLRRLCRSAIELNLPLHFG